MRRHHLHYSRFDGCVATLESITYDRFGQVFGLELAAITFNGSKCGNGFRDADCVETLWET
ncbi:hypothetical protein EJ08DRAFT_651195 [Tothia fuscella]|uniref:Uncharacterized protein n=1 Tax=Tothia fuscella TaxID=1048955 RepID=A0A9P4TWL5_9PEZI|nr:hypothetical protein EJ08DRAFT_651195 [Tothia fuscella]